MKQAKKKNTHYILKIKIIFQKPKHNFKKMKQNKNETFREKK